MIGLKVAEGVTGHAKQGSCQKYTFPVRTPEFSDEIRKEIQWLAVASAQPATPTISYQKI
jgi:hypothetical protein